ncbi:ABC transporter ATP-binding protein [Clostridium sp.]|uniref:ABC transporter ATP-binding protein n=1 Tax=Clostridium sp. TaxID=1506 RepID=UPI00290B5A09|nr:ABC transporter ATP-binding protein [Clostridium sp.]MDU5106182.1 ABC transporter ATP-binding protein [Clostridium sp.]
MEYVIETKNLTKKYGNSNVVDNINLHVPKGKIYGLLGRNGAGKTTTMKMMLKLIKVTKGNINLFGEDFRNNNLYKKIGSIIETPGFYQNLTARDNLNILAKLHGNISKKEIQEALEIVGLHTEEKKTFSNFSLGMKQRLGIAAAIMHNPELLILDEPINGLDPIGISEIRSFLLKLSHEKGVTIFISSHVLSEIEQIADVIGVMNNGKLIEEVNILELQDKLKHYIEITVSDTKSAEKILKDNFSIKDYSIIDNNIYIYDSNKSISDINRSLVQNGISVTKLNPCKETLEAYFENLIGGGGIA